MICNYYYGQEIQNNSLNTHFFPPTIYYIHEVLQKEVMMSVLCVLDINVAWVKWYHHYP